MRTALFIPILMASSGALAQQPVRVEPGHADISPVAISQRKVEPGQQIPTGFDGVYEFSKVDAFGRGQTMFMRVDGAVSAVFPQSVYVPTRVGMVPDIPPGTIFHIGPIRQTRRERNATDRPDTYINYSASAQAPIEPRPQAVDSSPSIILDEAYRQTRIAVLMARAAGQ